MRRLLYVQVLLVRAIVCPIAWPLQEMVTVSRAGAVPLIAMFGLFVMPSWLLTPLSWVIPVMTGVPATYRLLPSTPSAWPPPECWGLPLGMATMGEASVGGVVPLKLRPRA